MKKYIFSLVFGLFLASPALASVPDGTYFFMDNKGYNEAGTQAFFCLGTTSQTCYTEAGDFAFVRELQAKVAELTQKVTDLQNTVTQLQQNQQSPTALVPVEESIFNGSPFKIRADLSEWNEGKMVSKTNSEDLVLHLEKMNPEKLPRSSGFSSLPNYTYSSHFNITLFGVKDNKISMCKQNGNPFWLGNMPSNSIQVFERNYSELKSVFDLYIAENKTDFMPLVFNVDCAGSVASVNLKVVKE